MKSSAKNLDSEPPKKQHSNNKLTKYNILKMTLSGDYLGKDRLEDSYLLCNSTRKIKQQNIAEFNNTNILQSIEIIQEEGNNLQVFQLPQRLMWAGDINSMSSRSQLQCLSLLYNAIKQIITPLVKFSSTIASVVNFLTIQNLWVKDNRCYLLLCRRSKNRNIKKIQYNQNAITLESANSKQFSIISRFGQVFWDIFYQENQDIEHSRCTFRQILKAMIKKKINTDQIVQIMQDKAAKKKFIVEHVNRKLPFSPSIAQKTATIQYQNVYQHIQNIPISLGRRTLFFKSNNKGRNISSKSRSYRKYRNSLDLIENINPPSFSKEKKNKRYSLFSETKQKSHTICYESLIRQNLIGTPLNKDRYKRTLGTTLNEAQYFTNKNISKFNKQKKQLRSIFQCMKSNKQTFLSTQFERRQIKSEQKALSIFKSKLDSEKNNGSDRIDDSYFKSSIKEKNLNRKKNIQYVIQQASKILEHSGKQQNIQLNFKDNKFTTLCAEQQSMTKTNEGKSRQLKVYNQNIVSNKQDRLFDKVELPKQNQYFSNQQNKQSQKNLAQIFSKQLVIKIPESKQQLFSSTNKKETNQDNQISIQLLESIQKSQQQLKKPILNIPERLESNKYIKQKQIVSNANKDLGQNSKNKQKQKFINQAIKQQYIDSERILKIRDEINQAGKKQLQNQRKNLKQKQQSQIKRDYYDTNKKIQQTILSATSSQFKKKEKQFMKNVKNNNNRNTNSKQHKVSRNIFSNADEFEDQIQQIQLVTKPKNIQKPLKIQHTIAQNQASVKLISSPNIPQPKQQNTSLTPNVKKEVLYHHSIQNPVRLPQDVQAPIKKSEELKKDPPRKVSERIKTGQSAGSEQGVKSVRKQIDEYLYMVNKMGQAVAKSGKLSKKLEKVDWYVGVYFLYKRFYYERKKIEKYFIQQTPKITRYDTINIQQWKQWLAKGERDGLLNKCQDDNRNIETSLKKMAKKMQNMQLPASIALNIPITKNLGESSMIAIDCIMNEYDQLVSLKLLNDPEIYVHINEMVNALWVMSELDGKIQQKKGVLEYGNIKRSHQELNKLVKLILNFYYQED